MRQLRLRSLCSVFLLFALAAFGACNGSPESGTVTVSLVGQAPSGTIYRLRTAIIMVQGPSSTTFWNTEEDLTRTSLSANVVVGQYVAFLQEGWRLEKLVPGMPPVTVPAQLLSPNPQPFAVADDIRTTVPLRFRVDEGEIDMNQGYDIVIDVEEPSPATPGYCDDNSDCATGETCCMGGFLGTCRTLATGEACPLPDLTISLEAAQQSLSIDYEAFTPASCAIVEGCVGGSGNRRLLRFSTQTPNIGEADMIMGDPTGQPGFNYSSCHGHYHFEGYAQYQLIDSTGMVAATGHKQAFCLLDLAPMPGTSSQPRYHCGFQGIQAGWSDVYGSGLDCQWVDITGVAEGNYSLRITINQDRTLPESDYTNNSIDVPVTITPDVPPVPGDPLSACNGGAQGPGRDCGWVIAAGQQGVACTPGESVTLGCGCDGVGTCAADPVLRVCDGTEACIAASALASVDDTCGYCPQTAFVCPPSGVYTVLTGAFAPGAAYTCEVGVVAAP
jgi:hypothetical protein